MLQVVLIADNRFDTIRHIKISQLLLPGGSIGWTHSIIKQSHNQEPWHGARVNPRNNSGIGKVVVSQRTLKII